ncbi:MAG: TadE/TadG family type IV pilus assembly protein [Pseudomonadota bacterium]
MKYNGSRRQRVFGPTQLLLRRFGRNKDGAAAVEFALIAIPFFALLFAILETALSFFAGQLLETGVFNASRLIRTGQAQEAGFSANQFRDAVCDEVFGLLDCQNDIVVDVRTYVDFNDAANLDEPVQNGEFNFQPQFDPGDREEIVVVRAFIQWPTIVPKLGNDMSNLSNGNRLLASAVTFRNEPF